MSADNKPDKPADVPPFLQTKPGPSPNSNPKPSPPPGDDAPEIPFFLRVGAAAVPPEQQPRPKPPPPGAQTTRRDPGVLFSLGGASRPSSPVPPPAPSAPSMPSMPSMPQSPLPSQPEKPAPAFLRSDAQLPERDLELPGLLSPEEVQRKLEDAARALEKKEAAAAPLHAPVQMQAPKDRPQTKTIDWESAPEIFEQMVEGIRRDRVSHEREMMDQASKVETDWQHVLDSMRALQRKVEGHPNLIYFTISRDQQDISIKVVDSTSKRGYSLFTLSRRHPAGAHPSLNAVWLIEFPAREWHYYDAKEAMAELVARIAGALA